MAGPEKARKIALLRHKHETEDADPSDPFAKDAASFGAKSTPAVAKIRQMSEEEKEQKAAAAWKPASLGLGQANAAVVVQPDTTQPPAAKPRKALTGMNAFDAWLR